MPEVSQSSLRFILTTQRQKKELTAPLKNSFDGNSGSEIHKKQSTVADCPKPVFPEYAFAGRSNSGKSSLLNMIAGRKKVASTSSTPGKTRLINHFMVNDSWYMVDLPGYGYARVSGKTRQLFPVMMDIFLTGRIWHVFVAVD